MASAHSEMLPLGTAAPAFELRNAIDDGLVRLSDLERQHGLLVMFICNHCPYVVHIREKLGELCDRWLSRGLAVVAVNSNSLRTHPQDGPAAMKALAIEKRWRFPFLFDETQQVAREYDARCTPDFFLFDGQRKLVYRGQFDDSRPGNSLPVIGNDLELAVDSLLSTGMPVPNQKPSIGCSIKWD